MTNLDPGQASKWSLPLYQGQWRAANFLPKLPALPPPGRRASFAKRCWIAAGILCLYGVGCVLPVLSVLSDAGIPGIWCLVFGWYPPFTLPWSANVLLVVGLVYWLSGHVFKAYGIGLAGAFAALSSWSLAWLCKLGWLGPGYYCWQLSLILLAFAGWWEWYRYGSCEFEKPEPKLST